MGRHGTQSARHSGVKCEVQTCPGCENVSFRSHEDHAFQVRDRCSTSRARKTTYARLHASEHGRREGLLAGERLGESIAPQVVRRSQGCHLQRRCDPAAIRLRCRHLSPDTALRACTHCAYAWQLVWRWRVTYAATMLRVGDVSTARAERCSSGGLPCAGSRLLEFTAGAGRDSY